MPDASTQSMLDSLWVLFAAFLVFFMHAGFALVESGFCRKKNAIAVLLKNFGVVSIASVAFYGVGYGLMFGEGTLVGAGPFFPQGDEANVGTLPIFVFLFFQLVFAATACTIVSGAVAERARLVTFLAFSALATAFIYPVVGHWVWGGGWLAELGFKDFAGSTVVHLVGGAMALAGAIAVGPRDGKYDKDGAARPFTAHNFPLAALGVLILWLGWFGFNGGSTVSAENPGSIARIVLVTNLSASVGFLSALGWVKWRTGSLDLSMGLNGALAGLVSITAGCDLIAPLPAMGVGLVGAVLCVEGVFLLDRKGVDDPVGAVAVHGICGAFGTLAVGLVGEGVGVFLGFGAGQLVLQALGVVAAFAFAFSAGGALWFGMKFLVPGGIRVDIAHEHEGLDLAECGVSAYGEELSAGHG